MKIFVRKWVNTGLYVQVGFLRFNASRYVLRRGGIKGLKKRGLMSGCIIFLIKLSVEINVDYCNIIVNLILTNKNYKKKNAKLFVLI